MKKLFLAAAAVLGVSTMNAQVEEGNSLVSLNVGVGSTFAASTAKASLPLFATYEYAISEKITVGGFGSYAGAKYEFGNTEWKWTYIWVGAVGNYHFVNDEKLDAYAGARLGYINVSFDDGGSGGINPSASGVGYALQVGGRYWVTESIGINAELGYGFAYLRAGVTFKF